MKLLHRSFFSLAFLLILFGLAGAQGAVFTVQFKASPTREEAEEEVRQLKAKNISAYIVKSVVPGKGVFYRVRAGVFSTSSDAKKFGANLQQRGVVPDFFVTPYEKPTDDFASGSTPTEPTGPPKTKAPARPAPESVSNNAPSDTRPARQIKSESAPLNNARDGSTGVASAGANKPATVARNNPPTDTPATPANSPTRSRITSTNN